MQTINSTSKCVRCSQQLFQRLTFNNDISNIITVALEQRYEIAWRPVRSTIAQLHSLNAYECLWHDPRTHRAMKALTHLGPHFDFFPTGFNLTFNAFHQVFLYREKLFF